MGKVICLLLSIFICTTSVAFGPSCKIMVAPGMDQGCFDAKEKIEASWIRFWYCLRARGFTKYGCDFTVETNRDPRSEREAGGGNQ